MNDVIDIRDKQESTGGDTAVQGLDPVKYMGFVDEIRNQPDWRAGADKCCDYYDDNQTDAETLADLKSKGLGDLIENVVKPTVNTVLGMEAKMRTDWRVTADSDDQADAAEAMSVKIMEAERESRADRACSEGYASQIKAGVGWTEVSRNANPFKYPYRVAHNHRREHFWDWRAKEADLTDERFHIRQRWFPIEELIAYMPNKERLIRAVGMGWGSEWLQQAKEDVSLMRAFDQEARYAMSDWEWRNYNTQQVAVQECWYRVYVRGYVLRLPDDRVVEFNKKNPLHVALVGTGQIKPQPAVYTKMRASLWIGPHKVQDEDFGIDEHPYVPWWGYREDLTGVPYGLIRSMIPMQDEVNARRRKLLWLLSAKRVEIDSDALDEKKNDLRDFAREINRPDAIIIRNPNRRNAKAIEVDSQLGLAQQQFEIMVESKQAIQEVAGIFNAMMGRADGVKSGIALNSLVEQGTVALADINDNASFARRLTGNKLLRLIQADMSGRQIEVTVGEWEKKRKVILNKPAVDPVSGIRYLENDMSRARLKVTLDDVPSTPAYRAQQMMMMNEVMQTLPDQIKAVIAPFWLEASDLSKRREMVEAVRKVMGMDGEDMANNPQMVAMLQQIQELTASLEEGEQRTAEMQAKLTQMVSAKAADDASITQKRESDSRKDSLERDKLAQAEETARQDRALRLMEQDTRDRELELKQEEQRIERDRLAAEAREAERQRKHDRELEELRLKSAEKTAAETAKSAKDAEGGKKDEAAEINAMLDKFMKPFMKQLSDVEKAVDRLSITAEATAKAEKKVKDEQKTDKKPTGEATNLIVQVGGGKKVIKFQHDESGKIVGGEIDESGGKKPE